MVAFLFLPLIKWFLPMRANIKIGDISTMSKNSEFDVIFHGANCMHAMGSGVAKSLVKIFPEIEAADKKTIRGDKSKIGTYSYSVITLENNKPLVILNCYTQHYYGKFHYKSNNGFDYLSFEKLCKSIISRLGGRGLRFGYPLIASDRGNASPEKILEIINNAFIGEDHTLVIMDEPGRRKSKFLKELLIENNNPLL